MSEQGYGEVTLTSVQEIKERFGKPAHEMDALYFVVTARVSKGGGTRTTTRGRSLIFSIPIALGDHPFDLGPRKNGQRVRGRILHALSG